MKFKTIGLGLLLISTQAISSNVQVTTCYDANSKDGLPADSKIGCTGGVKGETTIENLYKDGWRLAGVYKPQFYGETLIFEKEEPKKEEPKKEEPKKEERGFFERLFN